MDAVAPEEARERHRQVRAAERALNSLQNVHPSIRAYCSAPPVREFGAVDAPPTAAAAAAPRTTTYSPLHRFLGPHGHDAAR